LLSIALSLADLGPDGPFPDQALRDLLGGGLLQESTLHLGIVILADLGKAILGEDDTLHSSLLQRRIEPELRFLL
jgi:hypothetical protein